MLNELIISEDILKSLENMIMETIPLDDNEDNRGENITFSPKEIALSKKQKALLGIKKQKSINKKLQSINSDLVSCKGEFVTKKNISQKERVRRKKHKKSSNKKIRRTPIEFFIPKNINALKSCRHQTVRETYDEYEDFAFE